MKVQLNLQNVVKLWLKFSSLRRSVDNIDPMYDRSLGVGGEQALCITSDTPAEEKNAAPADSGEDNTEIGKDTAE